MSIDWARLSGPRANAYAAAAVLRKFCGEWENGKGRFLLGQGLRFACEAGVFVDADGEGSKMYAVVDLPGAALAMMSDADRLDLLRRLLHLGFKGTRVDLALDCLDGTGAELIERIEASCRAGELCGARKWHPDHIYDGQSPTQHMIRIGTRGTDGSGRYLRCYDKGLETRSAAKGDWVRYEVEFASDCAAQALEAIIDAPDSAEAMRAYALGSFDFRLATGDKNVSRRPLVEWWASFIEGTKGVRVRAQRALRTLAGYSKWIRDAVLPGAVTLAKEARISVEAVLTGLAGDLPDARPSLLRRAVMWHAADHLKGMPA